MIEQHPSISDRIAQRFFHGVVVDDEDKCWEWKGPHNRYGYGLLHTSDYVLVGAHRIAYVLLVGAIPAGMSVCHSCDNRGCVNPGHLWLGLQRDNALDMYRKGRARKACGEMKPNAKLTWDAVNEIRASYPRLGLRQLAERFGVTQGAIWNVVNGKAWTRRAES